MDKIYNYVGSYKYCNWCNSSWSGDFKNNNYRWNYYNKYQYIFVNMYDYKNKKLSKKIKLIKNME